MDVEVELDSGGKVVWKEEVAEVVEGKTGPVLILLLLLAASISMNAG